VVFSEQSVPLRWTGSRAGVICRTSKDGDNAAGGSHT